MRILFLSGANSIHTVRWVNSLVDNGHEVHLIYNSDHISGANIIDQRVIQHKLRYKGSLGYYINSIQLMRIFKNICPDVVNAHYASGYGTLSRITKIKPLILSVWGSDVYDFPYQSKIKMKIIRKNLLYANKIASTSFCMGEQVRKLLNTESVNIEVTPFGVDLEKFSRKIKEKDDEKLNIGIIKTLNSKYGISFLIHAMKILIDNLEIEGRKDLLNKISLYIYGDGSQKQELIDLVVNYNLENVIFFKGTISNSDVPKALEEFDIFCVTSILDSESFGVAVVEAMAMELPVVATDVDGFKEVVEDGVTGIIVERMKPDVIAEALMKLILDKNLRKEMGKKGRERVLKLYDWKENVAIMEQLYSNTII
jgi:glycosyltransferase involved in cell wall biosynthesis